MSTKVSTSQKTSKIIININTHNKTHIMRRNCTSFYVSRSGMTVIGGVVNLMRTGLTGCLVLRFLSFTSDATQFFPVISEFLFPCNEQDEDEESLEGC
jgi:hypothetical protein